MALRKQHECNRFGCTNLTRDRFCNEHMYIEKEEKKQINRRYNAKRTDDVEQRFYKSKEWKMSRRVALSKDEYLCQDCKSMGYIVPASTVHHIIPIKMIWEYRLYISNMISLCESCHQKRHRILNQKRIAIMLKTVKISSNPEIDIKEINRVTSPHIESLKKQEWGTTRGAL